MLLMRKAHTIMRSIIHNSNPTSDRVVCFPFKSNVLFAGAQTQENGNLDTTIIWHDRWGENNNGQRIEFWKS